MADEIFPNTASALSGFGERLDCEQFCAHCGQLITAGEQWGRICPDCFVIGHRGATCDEYCKPDPMAALLVKSLRPRPDEGEANG